MGDPPICKHLYRINVARQTRMGEKKGATLVSFLDPLLGTILVSFWEVFWSILGGFWHHLGRRRRGILVMFPFAFCSLAAGLSQDFGREFRVLCCFGSLVFFCLVGVPWCFLWSLVSLSPVYERSARSD